jgi:hypothetical protein
MAVVALLAIAVGLVTLSKNSSLLPAESSVVFRDYFSDTSSGWPSEKGASDYDTSAGGYRITFPSGPGGRFVPIEKAGNLDDVKVEVDATTSDGAPPGASWGVICRVNGDSYYQLAILKNGAAGIWKVKDTKGSLLPLNGYVSVYYKVWRATRITHLDSRSRRMILVLSPKLLPCSLNWLLILRARALALLVT